MPLYWDTEHVRFLYAFKEQKLCFLKPSGFLVHKLLWTSKSEFLGVIFREHDSQAVQPSCPFILVLLIIRNKICINLNFTSYLHSSPKNLSAFHIRSERVFISS